MKFECAIGTKRMHDLMGTPIRDLGHDKRKIKKVKQLIGLRRCVKYKVSSSQENNENDFSFLKDDQGD